MRAGGAGQITALHPAGRSTLARFSDHVYAAARVQKYWLATQQPNVDISTVKEPHDGDRYPIALAIARTGLSNWAMLPLQWLPRPDPLEIENKGQWEKAHGPYEESWIDLLNLQPPYGYSKMRSAQSKRRARPGRQLGFGEWFDNHSSGESKPVMGLPQRADLGLTYVVPIIHRWRKSIQEGRLDPAVHFSKYPNTQTVRDSYYVLQQRPGLVGISII